MKDTVGIIKDMDDLGRVVVPKEFRERCALKKRLEIVATPEGVLIRNPEYKLVRIEKEEIK